MESFKSFIHTRFTVYHRSQHVTSVIKSFEGIGKEKLMFPNSAKASLFASGRTRLGLTLALALSMILPAIFSYSTAQAGTVSGEFCIEGIVIDWEEQPMGGLYVYLDGPVSQETQSAGEEDDDFADDNDDLDEGEFKFPVEDGDDLEPGTYVLSIELPQFGNWEGVTDTEFEVTLDANQDDCAQVRFKLRQLVEVNVLKINEDHEGLEDWVIEARPGPGNFFAEVQEETTDVDGYAYFELTPGNWIFVESAPMPENGEMKAMFTPVAPPQGKMELDVQPGEPYTIRFKNRMEKTAVCWSRRSMTRVMVWPVGESKYSAQMAPSLPRV
jgi:hypothetical protein